MFPIIIFVHSTNILILKSLIKIRQFLHVHISLPLHVIFQNQGQRPEEEKEGGPHPKLDSSKQEGLLG